MTNEEFQTVFRLSGKKYQCGEYYVLEHRKVHIFKIGADGTIWNITPSSETSSALEINAAVNEHNFLGAYERRQ